MIEVKVWEFNYYYYNIIILLLSSSSIFCVMFAKSKCPSVVVNVSISILCKWNWLKKLNTFVLKRMKYAIEMKIVSILEKMFGIFLIDFYMQYSSTREKRVVIVNLLDKITLWVVDVDSINSDLKKKIRNVWIWSLINISSLLKMMRNKNIS